MAQTSQRDAVVPAFPGATVIGMVRRLLVVSVIAAFAFSALMVASRGYCAGGFDGQGGFIDASGRPVDVAPRCIQLALGPSPLFYVGIALLVFLAIGRAMKASDGLAARRVLNLSTFAVVGVVVFAIVVSQVWFRLVPIEDFGSGSWSIFSPLPFGTIDVEMTSMTMH